MNLYIISFREAHYERHEYDEVRSALVAAATPAEARSTLHDYAKRGTHPEKTSADWLNAALTSVRWIGTARHTIRKGVLLADVHEG